MRVTIAAVLFLALLLAIPASAHVPGIAEGDVVVVPDAEKSYAWYGSLEDGNETDQYRITAEEGMEIRLSVSTPDPGVSPSAALIGPGIAAHDPLPGTIDVPEGEGSILIPASEQPVVSYEPFTPMALYEISGFSTTAPARGDYSVMVFGDTGIYILATGFKEEFSVAEWVLIPVSVLSVRGWQGQSVLLNLLVILGTVLAGAWWFRSRKAASQWRGIWLLAIAGFAYIGSGVLVFIQMVIAGLLTGPVPTMLLTALFAAIPVILGALLVRAAGKAGPSPSLRDRAVMAVLGLLGIVFWAGLIAGPVLAIAASLVPGAGQAKES